MEPSAANEIDNEDYEVSDGVALSVLPPAPEHMEDPVWWDQAGRDMMDQKAIFRMQPGPERTQRLRELMEEYPRYTPKMYEKGAGEGRADIIRELLSLGASMDIEQARKPRDDVAEDDKIPSADVEPAIIEAAFHGQLECIKVLVEEGKVDVNTPLSKQKPLTALTQAAIRGFTDIVEWLLAHDAEIAFGKKGMVDDTQAVMKCGYVDILIRLLEDRQLTARNFKLAPSDIRYAACSGEVAMVEYVLEHAGFPRLVSIDNQTDVALPLLSPEQRKSLVESLDLAISSRSVDTLRLLLSYLTPRRADGSFEFCALDEGDAIEVFNSTEDAMEEATDIPELFELVWETLLCPPQEELDASEKARERRYDWLSRRLISACSEGCPETVKLICEKYGGNINHVSHKLSSTPLGRAAGSGKNPLPPRLTIAKYLLEQPGINIHLAQGNHSNDITALGKAIAQGQSQVEMVKLFLAHGGPVELIYDKLVEQARNTDTNESVTFFALVFYSTARRPVWLISESGYHLIAREHDKVTLKVEARELERILDNLVFRKPDSVLAEEDPKKRPLYVRQRSHT